MKLEQADCLISNLKRATLLMIMMIITVIMAVQKQKNCF
jgi:hypothetical protein